MNNFKSGFVTIIGKPNVGKSSILNNLIGEKISIISSKPQTTRNKITAIMTQENAQVIFLDTPGIHKGKNKLDFFMKKEIEESLDAIDLILYVVEANKALDAEQKEIISSFKSNNNIILVLNKIDKIEKQNILPLIQNYANTYSFLDIIPISALKNEGMDILKDVIIKNLKQGPKFYPDDMITDQPEKAICSEIVREKALNLLDQEIPHGLSCQTTRMKEKKDIVDIEVTIYCEKDSHKGIVIGKKGSMLKKIGSLARKDIESFLGTKVFLTLWVKVKKDWRNNDYHLQNFGYK